MTARRLWLVSSGLILFGGIALLVLAGAIRSAEAGAAPRGGTFRIAFPRGVAGPFEDIDPALVYTTALQWDLLDATCAPLLRLPDLPPPAGYRPFPEAAAAYPTVSADGKTYTFAIRPGFRFSDGRPLTARNFAAAIGRLKNPALDSPGAVYAEEIVSAHAPRADRLVIRLSKPVPDLNARLTMHFFCPVPLGLPPDPEGVGAPFSGAGPYYIATFERGRRLVALRNPYYRGSRPRHVDRIVVDVVEADAAVPLVERGQADHAPFGSRTPEAVRQRLIDEYGVNRSQYFVVRAPLVWWLALNTERPLFKGNARLRQAINFAVDRPAILQTQGPRAGNTTDQYLPPTMPGFRNALIYPLKGPDLAKARALARGHTRSGKAVLYVADRGIEVAAAAMVQANLKQIGLDVELKTFPPNVFHTRIGTRGEPFDIAYTGWVADYVDPANFFLPLDGRTIRDRGNNDTSYFNSSTLNRLLDRASRLPGAARYRALGELDVRVARDEAPLVALWHANVHVFVSKRVGCLLFNGNDALNIGAVCLKR